MKGEGQRRCEEINHQKRYEKDQQALEAGGIGRFRVEVFLNEVPDRAYGKHHVDEGRDQRQKNLEDQDVGESDPAEDAFARDYVAMLPDGLKNSEGPAEALAHERIGAGGGFGEGESAVFVFDAMAVAQEGHGEIGVFGHGVDMVAASLVNRS